MLIPTFKPRRVGRHYSALTAGRVLLSGSNSPDSCHCHLFSRPTSPTFGIARRMTTAKLNTSKYGSLHLDHSYIGPLLNSNNFFTSSLLFYRQPNRCLCATTPTLAPLSPIPDSWVSAKLQAQSRPAIRASWPGTID